MSPENTIFLVKTNETRMSVSSGLVYIPPVITAEIFLVLCSVLVHPSHVSAGIALAFLAGAPVLVQLFLYLTWGAEGSHEASTCWRQGDLVYAIFLPILKAGDGELALKKSWRCTRLSELHRCSEWVGLEGTFPTRIKALISADILPNIKKPWFNFPPALNNKGMSSPLSIFVLRKVQELYSLT